MVHSVNGHVKSVLPPFYKAGDVLAAGLQQVDREGDIDYPFEDISPHGGDENKIRGNWSSKMDFIVSCLGFTVGLGNIWRFPYYCFTNGGGAFLIPYTILLCLTGIPLFFMEFCLGQFASLGCVSVWKVCPLFKGIGVAMFLVSCFIGVYYNMLVGWSMYYLVSSFKFQLPWSTCENPWNSDSCVVWDSHILKNCTKQQGKLLRNGTCVTKLEYGKELFENLTAGLPEQANWTLPSNEYFHRQMLNITGSLESIGNVRWQLAICLLVAWLIVFICLFKGIKTSGKVAYVTTFAPYIILIVLFVRALTLPGSTDGLLKLLSFDYKRLADAKVWGEAACQVFFSLSCCMGGLITLASYNKFHNDCYRDCWIIVLLTALSAFCIGCVVFSMIGAIAHQLGRSISDLPIKGPGLAFIVYAEALARLPVAPLWSVLFFTMIIMLGIDTEFFLMETVVTNICDEFPERFRKSHRHVLIVMTFIFFAAGVPMCTQGGMYILQLLDYFCAGWSLLIIGLFECLVLAWAYGIDNFLDNIKWMVNHYPRPYLLWKIMWKFVTPVLILLILLFSFMNYQPLTYNDYQFPVWSLRVGWGVSFFSVSAIPLIAFYRFCAARGGCCKRFRELICPEDDWGPALAVHRAEHFPLQVPESRTPFVHSAIESADADTTLDFDKETAI